MKRLIRAAVAVGLAVALSRSTYAGAITYEIQSYSADQNGANVSGTITTDGVIGKLAASDILSWSWTITPSGGTATSFSSSNTGARVFLIGSVAASQSDITLAAGAPTNDFALLGGRYDLEYDRGGDNAYYGLLPGQTVWQTYSPVMGRTNPWVIAVAGSVPEPSSLALAALGAAFGLAYWLARKRVTPRAATV